MNENVLVLGFYDRKNIGDDSYKLTFPSILGKPINSIQFACMDDITSISPNINIVIIGGGDVINDYFMTKAYKLLENFPGRVYGLSVGIPYESSAKKYLQIFDHLFVRSKTDQKIAAEWIGEENVTFCPDAALTMNVERKRPQKQVTHPSRIGICLAQPAFYSNLNRSMLIKSITNAINRYVNISTVPLKEIHLIPFNYNQKSKTECDIIINEFLEKQLKQRLSTDIVIINHENLTSPYQYLNLLRTMDMNICMRYHSILFSVLTNTPYIALYCSQKVGNVLKDMNHTRSYKLPTDENEKPISIDEDQLLTLLLAPNDQPNYQITPYLPIFRSIQSIIFKEQRLAHLKITHKKRTFNEVLISCKRNLCKYFGWEPTTYETILTQKAPLPPHPIANELEVARFICFIITARLNHPCVWGLSENILRSDFCLLDAIKYIWDEEDKSINSQETEYYPYVPSLKRNVLFDVNSIFQNDFLNCHRSGWAYVVGALMNLDALTIGRKASNILIDTYVDRTFHWGYNAMKTIGEVPYTTPWYGFIHHTFDETHSSYNCVQLFKNPDFLISLQNCKGLLALSSDLAQKLKAALPVSHRDVPVYTLYHPMEFVDNLFTMQKFAMNPKKRIVQIGAWLRNPYAIYELPMPSNTPYIKTALKGKEMDNYFAPEHLFAELSTTLLKTDWHAEPCHHPQHLICRSEWNNAINKYCKGLYDHIIANHSSIEIMEKIPNDEYDQLLCENIVFLNLIDVSACNTVIECIVRHTPILVNRLPALEEILGKSYPGFYSSYHEAVTKMHDFNTIQMIHYYLTRLNKDRYRIENFIRDLQDIVERGKDNASNYPLLSPAFSIYNQALVNKFPGLLRYLPPRFQPE